MDPSSVSLTLTRLDEGAATRCPGCRAHLDLHQPDAREPERLLGVCGGCRAWFAIDYRAGLMGQIPTLAADRP